jgi:hypothetical protein
MKELTDLEICKRIAEIEGLEISCEWDCGNNGILIGKGDGDLKDYNPLKDDALNHNLMIKYKIRVEPENCSAWTDNDDGYPQYEVIHCKGTINEAICLAIIKSKGGI